MADIQEHLWLEAFQREVGIRRAILLHGEVLDICYDKRKAAYHPVIDVVLRSLEDQGFDKVVVWDPFSGVANIAPDNWAALMQEAVSIESNSEGVQAYDMGIETTPSPQQGQAPLSVEDFFSVVYYHMLNQKKNRIAIVLDWSQYLFGSANALSEAERRWLLILSKAIRNASVSMDVEDLVKPSNLIVVMCQNIGAIPPVFYQNSPAIQEVIVTAPGRIERQLFIKRTIDAWMLKNTPVPGDPAFNDFVDFLEGLSLLDLQQLIKLSRQIPGDPLTFERLINLYRYGESKSQWEDLNRSKLTTIRDVLKKRVKGQDEAIDKVARVIIRAFTGLSGLQHSKKQRMPKGTLFFVGPTGVGKTELAKALAQFLFGDEEACIRFDMSEFNHEHSDQRLVGAPPGYVGYEEGGQLTNAVKSRPFSVLLFDEIEKAHVRILDKFLQILEDGRLTDGKGETVNFSETIIIFTSNIGAAEIQVQDDTDLVRKEFLEKVRDHFMRVAKRPELLNRIGDNIVPFNFIYGDDFLISIAKSKLQPLRERLKEKYRIQNLEFIDEDRALLSIARCVDKQMGGRGVLNEIVKRIIDPLAEFLFTQEEDPAYFAGRTIVVIPVGQQAQFTFDVR